MAITDKDFFKTMKHEAKDFGDEFHETFPYWVLQIFNPTFSAEMLQEAVDGLDHDDDSIDAFWIDDDKREIFIVQCKSARSEKDLKACKKEWLSYLYDTTKKLKNLEYIDSHKNTRIQEIAADFSEAKTKKYSIHYQLFHLGYLPSENDSLIKTYNDKDDEKFDYISFRDIQSQWEEYKSRISMTEPKYFEFRIETEPQRNNIVRSRIGSHYTLIGLIPGSQLIKLRAEHKYKLFDKNVRFSLGKNKINTEIIETANAEPDNFYFYNNGITITCNSFKFKESISVIRVDHPQIINGAQTVDSLYSAYLSRINKQKRKLGSSAEAEKVVNDEFDRIRVMFRIIQSDSHESPFAIKVIKYNNSQNSIQIRDFYANKKEQVELQKKLSDLGYFYEIKRGERNYIKKEEHIALKKRLSDFPMSRQKMNIENISSSYRAFLGEPSAKEVGAKYILDDDNIYIDLFGRNPMDITDEKVNEIVLAYNLFQQLEEEARIYKRILILLSKVDKAKNFFSKLAESVQASSIFNEIVKKKFSSYENFLDDRDSISMKLKESFPFSQGKYQVLALFNVIMRKCNYLDKIYEYRLHHDTNFLKEQIVKKWLPICLDSILVPIYRKTIESDTISMNTFYLRTSTFENLRSKLKRLDMDLNKEFIELFPLNLANR